LERAQQLVASARTESWFGVLEEGGLTLDRDRWAQIRAWGDYDPRPDLEELTVPTLAILGAGDPLVPVPETAKMYVDTAIRAGRRQHVAIFPDGDHRLRTTSGDFAAGYLRTLHQWIALS
jgi:fermentation-respiration switch protein FrsA (DUF1100 family)